MKNNFQKKWFLTKFHLRKDWLALTIWIISLAVLMGAVALKFEAIYGTKSQIATIKSTLNTPAMQALLGTFKGTIKTTSDVFANEMILFMAIAMAAMNIYFAVRGSRGEEDDGLTELIASHAVGKMADFSSIVGELLIANIILTVLYGFGIQFSTMPGVDVEGSWLIAIALGITGMLFGSISLLMAQLADNSRSATAYSYGVFGIMYVARMYTDIRHPSQTWWVPLGWIEKINAFQSNDWKPVFYLIVLTIVVLVVALWVNQNRDIGSGLIPTRPGRKRASWALRGPSSLVFLLQKNSILIWMFGLFVLGATYGSIFNSVGDILKTNPTVQQVLGPGAIKEANHQVILNFISVLSSVMVAIASIPAVQNINRVMGDNNKGYLETVYAKSISRIHILSSYLVTSVISGLLALFASFLGMYVAGNASMHSGKIGIETYVHVFTASAPILLITIGIAVFINGVYPKLSVLTWIYLAYGFFAVYMGGLMKLPGWAKKVTAFGWLNKVPLNSVNQSYVITMLLIAVVLIIIGYVGYARRDLD